MSKLYITLPTQNREQLESYSLVLSAVGIDHNVTAEAGELLVAKDDAEQAIEQLASYTQENSHWPRPMVEQQTAQHSGELVTLLLFAALIFFYQYTGPWQDTNPWFEAGAVNREAIMLAHQWWRPVTALTLHADGTHILGNFLIGSSVVLLLSRVTGFGLCWFLIIFTGICANFCNVVFRGEQHLSVGFSTSVFAAIGIISGLRISWNKMSLTDIVLPLGAGLGLLAFLGSGGPRTDLGAHLLGFFCGVVTGVAVQGLNIINRFSRFRAQFLLFSLTLTTVIATWFVALHA